MVQHEANSFEKLHLLEFFFAARPNIIRAVDPKRISTLNDLPFEQRVVASAYYALELCNPSLKPLDYAHSRLEVMEPGTDKAIEIIDGIIIASAVQAEIVKSLNLYDPSLREIITEKTADFTPNDIGWLKAIQHLRNTNDPRKRIGRHTGRVTEAVACLTIARERGIQIPSADANWQVGVE